MKRFIIGSLILGVLLGWTFTRTMENRCSYYESLPNTTEVMRSVCEKGGDNR